jgi:predicted transcriptional regulator
MTSLPIPTLKRLMRQELDSRVDESSTIGTKRRALYDERCPSIPNPVWRQMVVEWCYQVIDHISADRELVYITMNILDRFLTVHHTKKDNTSKYSYLTDKKAYETAVMTSLLMTIKLQGISALCVKDLVQMSSNSVTSKEIIEVGKEIVQALTWNTQIPTAARFAHALVDLLPDSVGNQVKTSIFENAVYQIELSVQDEYCSRQTPSLVAWMAFENAICNAQIPPKTKTSVRSLVAEELQIPYNFTLRVRLHNFQSQSNPLSSIPAVIPPDEDQKSTPFLSEGENLLMLRSRPFRESHVISVENMTSIPSFPHEVEEKKYHKPETQVSTLRRTKRVRFY